MRREFTFKKIAFLLFLTVFASFGQHHEESHSAHAEEHSASNQGDRKGFVKEFIGHHLADTYDFGLFSYEDDHGHENHVGFSLPVILWDNASGLHIFSSSNFHHATTVAESNGSFYKISHSHIYATDNSGAFLMDGEGHHVKPLDFSITKNVFVIFVVCVLLFFVFLKMAKGYSKNALPTGFARVLEPLVLYVRDEIAIPNIGKKHYKKYMSFLLTVFFFVWLINLLGLSPLGVNVTNNIAVTSSLALITYVLTTFTANKSYWGHIFWMPGVPLPMKFLLAPIELLGTLIKPFSLMIRLYANITAGHIVLMSILGMIYVFKSWIGGPLSFGLAFFLSLLELLVAALQAYIFTMLSALYFGTAVEEHDDH